MGFDPNDDSDNDLPEWLKGMQSEEDDGFEPDDSISADSEEDLPTWLKEDAESGFSSPEEGDEEVPAWLANIRSQEDSEQDQHVSDSPEDEEDEQQAWLDSIEEKAEELTPQPEEEGNGEDFQDQIQAMGDEEKMEGSWDDEEEQQADQRRSREEAVDEIAAAWDQETAALESSEDDDEEEIPDWVGGLPSLDPAKPPSPREPQAGDQEREEEQIPEWLQDIREKTTEDTKQPEEVLPALGFELGEGDQVVPEDSEPLVEDSQEPVQEDEIDQVFAEEESDIPADNETEDETEEEGLDVFDEPPPDTGSLPTWLENLQTTGLVESTEDAEEERKHTAEYVEEEDVSALFEDSDIPDWLGEEVEEEQEPEEEEEAEEELPEQIPAFDEEIEKGDLPGWLQAMRPLDAVTGEPEEPGEDDGEEGDRETVGPLSGLKDVLPAEPHIIHFGSKPKLSTGFELTKAQKNYATLLKSLVDEESASPATKPRRAANPQQVLRWIITIVLLTITFAVLWWNGNILPLPVPGAIPEENLAAISLVNDVEAGEKVLVAFEYQPGLSGELQAASAALLDDLIWSGADLVLVSSQPVGPGLAESFLQSQFASAPYIAERGYTNLGYLSGGAAGLLNFAISPRDAKPEMRWEQAPLNAVQTIRDFALVLVITDDPDVARSWVEQVQPLLALDGMGEGVPLVMVVSAQAEPLVYPYYYATPRQVAGLVSGIGGGAFYESIHGPSLARRYWDAYNIGLVLAVIVVAGGGVINLTRTTLSGTGKGRS